MTSERPRLSIKGRQGKVDVQRGTGRGQDKRGRREGDIPACSQQQRQLSGKRVEKRGGAHGSGVCAEENQD